MGDCDSHQAQLKPVDEALAFLLDQVKPITQHKTLALDESLGRVLAAPVKSQVDVPPWDNSAMDGFAVNSNDLQSDEVRLRVAQRIPAGSVGTFLEPGTAARIFTGAPVPENADAVVIQEVCRIDGEEVVIMESPAIGANIRKAGEDILQGEEILPAGIKLDAQHLGLAASVGVAELSVFRRLKVAVFSSGDELVMPGEELKAGQIYNSNQFTLSGMLQRLGCEVIQLGIVEDTFEATCDALSRAAEEADLVLASGGVSVGEEDHVKPAVERLGSLELWKIASRPGKPLAFGYIGETPFMGAPGNPVSLFVTFSLFARPFILRMQGLSGEVRPKPVAVIAGFEKDATDKRQEYARGRLELNGQGQAVVKLYPNRSSGVLSSVVWANGLAVLPPLTAIKPGDPVDFIPYNELMT
ncbi:MAG: molybdopterin molybdotransferase MoeA [Candidatus Thiodiazotropha sp. (ex Lucina aurantia)]|uniref:Molybdopterin molybdenumtransferase n=1 Tax=Candidatus Thiodiazotropha taylori TaxID=2792791 RepID=A0A9E4TSU7_9GAMM|nr:molybdopterin molybdotransferase MoeA [Candidatus Thiodiazotropha sp. (ex Lucina pensylvanica)]MBT3016397.1 molybdopterin molybdotransferase MoeA [Candidatus Thiodiazotropha taylori]MBT3044612.1 molybdopterin molybdotransferase MoeA [Candidatus Thiodiazotropha sp. (ex Codakia orbicularis)]MBV2104012.1 molybdopterin molybdotransferase MoeA [Candidatus Thiodiazotropha sp. (ex Lucina aurantia)]MCG7863305.1 molybdopterin molybdotransferase MoeA [Candidatus Thiodiazotropha endolucinida]